MGTHSTRTLQEVREERKELLVELLVAASSDGTEQGPEQQEVVTGFRSRVG